MILTEDELKLFGHISTQQVEDDREITQREVDQLEAELDILRKKPQDNRVDIYFREGKIYQRNTFIEKLNQILNYRNID